jgi:hypothetical protein
MPLAPPTTSSMQAPNGGIALMVKDYPIATYEMFRGAKKVEYVGVLGHSDS